ncbi:hypothetical protein Tco_0435678 [Tanacetum coccineum]
MLGYLTGATILALTQSATSLVNRFAFFLEKMVLAILAERLQRWINIEKCSMIFRGTPVMSEGSQAKTSMSAPLHLAVRSYDFRLLLRQYVCFLSKSVILRLSLPVTRGLHSCSSGEPESLSG